MGSFRGRATSAVCVVRAPRAYMLAPRATHTAHHLGSVGCVLRGPQLHKQWAGPAVSHRSAWAVACGGEEASFSAHGTRQFPLSMPQVDSLVPRPRGWWRRTATIHARHAGRVQTERQSGRAQRERRRNGNIGGFAQWVCSCCARFCAVRPSTTPVRGGTTPSQLHDEAKGLRMPHVHRAREGGTQMRRFVGVHGWR